MSGNSLKFEFSVFWVYDGIEIGVGEQKWQPESSAYLK